MMLKRTKLLKQPNIKTLFIYLLNNASN